MIEKWSNQNLRKDLEYVKNGENLFVDDRGIISNHELTEPINLIGMIESKKIQLERTIIIHNKSKNVFLLKDKLLKFFKTY